MRKNSFLMAIMAALLVLTTAGCKSEKKRSFDKTEKDFIRPAEMTLEKSDTDRVRQLVNEFLEHQRNGEVDKALAMLHYLDGDSIKALPSDMAKSHRRMIDMFKGLEGKIDYMIFLKETDSEVKYTLTLFENEPGEHLPNKQSFVIKPVRRDGEWYITLADTPHAKTRSEVEKYK